MKKSESHEKEGKRTNENFFYFLLKYNIPPPRQGNTRISPTLRLEFRILETENKGDFEGLAIAKLQKPQPLCHLLCQKKFQHIW